MFSSVQFDRSVMSDCLRPHESQHARPPYSSPIPGVHSNSRPSSRWCYPVISSSVIPFSSAPNLSYPQSLFQWVNSLHEVAKELEFQLQHQSFQWTPRTDAKAETPVLWPPHAKSWFIGKHSDAGSDWGQEEKGTTEDEMAGWHHQLDGRESQWTPGVGDGQGGLACYSSWGRKESDTTKLLNWTELKTLIFGLVCKTCSPVIPERFL